MRPLDIVPPSAPSDTTQKKKGLFSRLFKKKEKVQVDDNSADLGDLDLDDIKKKIGLYEQVKPRKEPTLELKPLQQPTSPPPTIEMNELLKEMPKDTSQVPSSDSSSQPVYNINIDHATFAQQATDAAPLSTSEQKPKHDTQSNTAQSPQQDNFFDQETSEELPNLETDLPSLGDDFADERLDEVDDSLEGIEEPISIQTLDEPGYSSSSDANYDSDSSAWEEPVDDKSITSESSTWDTHQQQTTSTQPSQWEVPSSDDSLSSESMWQEPQQSGEPSNESKSTEWEIHDDPLTPDDVQATSFSSISSNMPDEYESDLLQEDIMTKDTPNHQAIAKEHLEQLDKEHWLVKKEATSLLAFKLPDIATEPTLSLDKKAETGKEFNLKNGGQLTTLNELKDAIASMDEQTWSHHVNADRNDFASWIQYVLLEPQLAEKLTTITSKNKFLKALKDHERTVKKHIVEHKKNVDSIIDHANKVQKAHELKSRMDQLKESIHKKKRELENSANLLTKTTHQKIEDEVQGRVAKYQEEIAAIKADLELKKQEFDERLSQVEQEVAQSYVDRESDLQQREKKVQAKTDSLLEMEKTIHEERRKAQALKDEATPLLEQAKKAQKEMEQLENRQRQLEEREHSQDELAQTLEQKEHSLVHREEELSLSRASLNQLEQQVTKQDALLRKEQENFQKLKKEFDDQKKQFKADEKKQLAEFKSEQKKLDERLKRAEAAEKRLESRLQEKRKISEYITDAQNLLKKPITKQEPKTDDIRNIQVYQLIDQAKDALKNKEVARARELYNKVRDAFNTEKLEPSEKSSLYAAIKELYDEIHMASLRS